MALNQCARASIRAEPDGKLSLFYNRLARKKVGAKSVIATSAKMLRIIYWVLKEKRPYYKGAQLHQTCRGKASLL